MTAFLALVQTDLLLYLRNRRALLMGGAMGAMFAVLGARMRFLSVEQADEFRLLAEENRINMRLIPPERGLIQDRNGKTIYRHEPRACKGCGEAAAAGKPAAPELLISKVRLCTRCGAKSARCWAIMPPMENPSRSTCLSPFALMKVMASSAICAMEFAGSPLDAPMPRLSKAITWCLAAMPMFGIIG